MQQLGKNLIELAKAINASCSQTTARRARRPTRSRTAWPRGTAGPRARGTPASRDTISSGRPGSSAGQPSNFQTSSQFRFLYYGSKSCSEMNFLLRQWIKLAEHIVNFWLWHPPNLSQFGSQIESPKQQQNTETLIKRMRSHWRTFEGQRMIFTLSHLDLSKNLASGATIMYTYEYTTCKTV